MGRSVSLLLLAIIVLALSAALTGCGGGSSAAPEPTPAIVAIAPANDVSLDLGLTQAFTAAALSVTNRVLAVSITFQSNNPSVVTIANNGLACAGSWDSLTNPVVCTPGRVGTAQVTASAGGIQSTPVTIYVHQHVDNVQIAPVIPPTTNCLSKDLTADFQATAFSRGMDITSTVGPFSWLSADNRVVTLSTTVAGLAINQAEATAVAPGITQIVASAAGVSSEPMPFTTCLVKSISLALQGGGGTSFTVSSGTKVIVPTIIDTSGITITGPQLTWTSSQPAVIGVSSSGVASATQPGSSTIIASCTPPNCNIGLHPAIPMYPSNVISGTVTGNTKTTTVWVTTKACNDDPGCVTTITSINVPANTLGASATLPSTPNSLVFSLQGTAAYLGSAHGLMVLNPSSSPPSVGQIRNVTGKVLAVSQDGKKVIVFDGAASPNVLFVFDTGSNTSISFPISGVTAADFSPDNLKAYIVAGSALYSYSTVDGLKTIGLNGPATDVSFFAEGAFAYLAGGAASPAVTVRRTCDNTLAEDFNSVDQVIPTATVPVFLRVLPNTTQALAVESPTSGIDVISIGTLNADDLCTLGPPPVPNISNGAASTINLGQGSFTPTQFLVDSASNRAFVLTGNLANILVYNVATQTSSPIQLSGTATAIQASLTPDSTLLYVLASDSQVHVLNPSVGGDITQVSFPASLCGEDTRTCIPDLIAVKP